MPKNDDDVPPVEGGEAEKVSGVSMEKLKEEESAIPTQPRRRINVNNIN